MRAVCLLAAGVVLADGAAAQVDPSGPWRSLHTAHFRVHFRPAYSDVAREAAREAERAYALLSAELRPPRGVIDLTLGDDVDSPNGFASVAPSNRVTILLAPPTTEPGLQEYDGWLRLVIVHELAHIFHLDRVRGPWAVLQRMLGRAPGLFPSGYQPSWVVEGLATSYESRLTAGGRAWGTLHTQVLGADRAGGTARSPWDALLFRRWPASLAPYAYGGRFFASLVAAAPDSGALQLHRFVEGTAGQWIPYRVGRPLRRAGVTPDLETAWRRTIGDAPAPPAAGADTGQVLAGALRFPPVPRVSPDGRRVAYLRDDGKGARQLVVLEIGEWRPLRSHRVTVSVSYDWLGDTLVVAQPDFTSRWRVRSDLYHWLPSPERAWRRVTRGARLTEPHVGGGVLATLRVGPADNAPTVPGVPDPPGATWGAVVPAPDGRSFAATRHSGGHWSLVRWPAGGADSAATLYAARGLVADPAWAPDGALLFVAGRDGYPQIHRWADGALEVAPLPLGARHPAPLADGSLLVSTLAARGWELRHVRPAWTPTEPAPTPPSFDSAPPVATRETGYAALGSLRPHFWIPLYRDEGPSGRFVGGATLGTDAVGRYQYAAEGLVAWDPVRAMGAVSVVSHALGNPSLDLAVSNAWSHVGTDSAGTVVSAEEVDAGLGATLVARRFRTQASLRLAAELEGVRYTARPDAPLAIICPTCRRLDLVGGSVTLGLAHFVSAVLPISPQDGLAWTATYRRREQQGSARWSDEVRSRLALYLRLPGYGAFAYPVLAVRVAVGATAGPLVERFSVGGVSSGPLELPLGLALGTSRTFPVRGYVSRTVRGRRAVSASVELRLPLALVGRSLGRLPVGADKLSLTLFGDAGNAWEPGAPGGARVDRLRSVGVELVGDLTVNYDALLRLRLGAAQPLADAPSGPRARFRVYLALGSDF